MTTPAQATTNYAHFPHDADLGVRGVGSTLAEAFEQVALALASAMVPLDEVAPRRAVSIHCAAPDNRLLLLDWLNALILQMAVHRMLFSHFQVVIGDRTLEATAWGEPTDLVRHQPSLEPKGATFAASRVEQQADGSWIAQCVVDV